MTSKTLHKWQRDGLEIILDRVLQGKRDGSVEAGVGSGKTRFSALFAKALLTRQTCEAVIVLTINRRCVRQWYSELRRQGIHLRALTGNSGLREGLPNDVQGYITTYHSLGSFPDLHEAFCGAKRTLAIFDEVHHLGDPEGSKSDWGGKAKQAFDSAVFRLSLSGTYFRSASSERIPFAEYQPVEGRNDQFVFSPHVKYTYGESVADALCRRVVFKPWDGQINFRREGDPAFQTARFDDPIEERQCGLRLRAALTVGPDNRMIDDMLFSANRMLGDLRRAGHANAGGIIVCTDTYQARDIKGALKAATGEEAVLVLSDEEGSSQAIDAYEKGYAPWIIAVRMVSEGVDIPRLRVCVYLANVTERLFFNQTVGRIVRTRDGPAGEAYLYYPGDERLIDLAEEIEKDVLHFLTLRKAKPRDASSSERLFGDLDAGPVSGEEQENIVAGERFTPTDIDIAEQMRLNHPDLAGLSIKSIAELVQDVRGSKRREFEREEAPPDDHDTLRAKAHRRTAYWAKLTGREHDKLNVESNKAAGIFTVKNATVQQLRRKLAYVEEQIAIARNGQAEKWFDDDDN